MSGVVCSNWIRNYRDMGSKVSFLSPRWIAKDVLRELRKPEIIERVKKKDKRRGL